jgi:hypothetical protein
MLDESPPLDKGGTGGLADVPAIGEACEVLKALAGLTFQRQWEESGDVTIYAGEFTRFLRAFTEPILRPPTKPI